MAKICLTMKINSLVLEVTTNTKNSSQLKPLTSKENPIWVRIAEFIHLVRCLLRKTTKTWAKFNQCLISHKAQTSLSYSKIRKEVFGKSLKGLTYRVYSKIKWIKQIMRDRLRSKSKLKTIDSLYKIAIYPWMLDILLSSMYQI